MHRASRRTTSAGIDRTFADLSSSRAAAPRSSTAASARPDRERLEIVGTDAALVLAAPFLSTPDGPPPSLVRWRDGSPETIDVPAVDQYALEAAYSTAAILDGTTPRVTLAHSRAHIATLARLDALARDAAGVAPAGRDWRRLREVRPLVHDSRSSSVSRWLPSSRSAGVWLVRGGQLLRPSTPAIARFVDETASSGSTTRSAVDPRRRPVAGWRSSIATRTDGRTSTSPAATARRPCSGTNSRRARERAGSRRRPGPRGRHDRRHR